VTTKATNTKNDVKEIICNALIFGVLFKRRVSNEVITNFINKNCKKRQIELLIEKSSTLLLLGIRSLGTRSLTLAREVSISNDIAKAIMMMSSFLLLCF